MPPTEADSPVIIFDGRCQLCNRWVDWIMRRDRQRRFRFATLDSEFSRSLLVQNPSLSQVDSIIVVDQNRTLIKADAVIYVASILGGVWTILRAGRLLRKSWRDAIYDLVARRRYRWFGESKVCRLPGESDRSRWLE